MSPNGCLLCPRSIQEELGGLAEGGGDEQDEAAGGVQGAVEGQGRGSSALAGLAGAAQDGDATTREAPLKAGEQAPVQERHSQSLSSELQDFQDILQCR